MKEKLVNGLNKYGRLLTGIGIAVCVVGLVFGYVRPKQKLETVAINMNSEGESDIPLEEGTIVEYRCSTKGYPMAGIQVGFTKYGKELLDSKLLMSVYDEKKEVLLSQSLISIGDVDEGQYLYLPFENEEKCNGTLLIEFSGSAPEGEAPGLITNSQVLEDAQTSVNAQVYAGNLKSYYVYKLAYYPMMFDLLTALFAFAGVFFLSGRYRKGKEERETADE